jgi:hypothetical protein
MQSFIFLCSFTFVSLFLESSPLSPYFVTSFAWNHTPIVTVLLSWVVMVSNFTKISRKSSSSTTWLTQLRTVVPSGFMLGIWIPSRCPLERWSCCEWPLGEAAPVTRRPQEDQAFPLADQNLEAAGLNWLRYHGQFPPLPSATSEGEGEVWFWVCRSRGPIPDGSYAGADGGGGLGTPPQNLKGCKCCSSPSQGVHCYKFAPFCKLFLLFLHE